jgi:transaldolase
MAAFAESQLDKFKKLTVVVADTGDIESMIKYQPTDATTNPSLIFAASKMPQYAHLVQDAVDFGKDADVDDQERVNLVVDKMAVNFGLEILKIVPGYVSTEVDARLSFDVEGTVARARRIISMYESAGVSKDRILIKIASTWEGFEAAKILKEDGINCNLTLLFSFCQAVRAAEVGVFLISPFVGRIMDWYKKKDGVEGYEPEEDPGVQSVRRIYNYYKKFGYETVVMGASFRNTGEILALGGCDRLTIGPKFLEQMSASTDDVTQYLSVDGAAEAYEGEQISLDEKTFRLMLNDDAMATEKLAEGIRGFSRDLNSLEDIIRAKLAE